MSLLRSSASSSWSRLVVGGLFAATLGFAFVGTGCSGGEIAIGKDGDALKNGPGSCAYGNARYANGESFPSTDGCNQCTCSDGGVMCTERACALEDAGPGSCTYDGKQYADGASFPSSDGCNQCTCSAGGVMCTERACALVDGGGGTCTYDGKTYTAGQSFPSTDGCNTCSCMDNGGVACTLRACAILDGGAD